MSGEDQNPAGAKQATAEKKSVVGVVVHSFFIIPFLIAVFSVIVFALVQLMIREDHSASDFLEDIKAGGRTKRWQAAFELAKILNSPEHIPDDARFTAEMLSAFEAAEHDDVRVRQYLALAMGRTHNPAFTEALVTALAEERPSEAPSLLTALGVLGDPRAVPAVRPYLGHADPMVRNRAAIALGALGDAGAAGALRAALGDPEPNVQWNAAVALAKLGDPAGKPVLRRLLDRSYLETFPGVDRREQDQALLVAIEAAALLDDAELRADLQRLAAQDANLRVREAAQRALP